MGQTHIIIGSSAAGISAVNTLSMLDPGSTIICISDEQELPYNKCHLADYVAGIKSQEQVHTYTHEKAAEKNINFILGVRVIAIDPQRKGIALSDGRELFYDTLLLATGTTPIIPNIANIQNAVGIFTFHGLRDVQSLLAYIQQHKPKHVVVIGSGLSGLECADALLNHGLTISIVEKGDRILGSLVTPPAALFIQQALHDREITLYSNETVVEIIEDHGHIRAVRCVSGVLLPADMLICAVGAKTNTELAVAAGMAMTNNAIAVNDYMQTSVPHIYAAGDIVLIKDTITGSLIQSRTWPDAMLQGLVAAHSMVGKQRAYPGAAVITSSAFFGLKFAVCGNVRQEDDADLVIKQSASSYTAFYLRNSQLVGFILVAETLNMGILKRMIMTKQAVTQEELLSL